MAGAGKRPFSLFRFSNVPLSPSSARSSSGGWTLIELVIVITIMAILSVGVMPLVKTSVRRQRELRLRETLREMREAIKEFHRDSIGMQCTGAAATGGAPIPVQPNPQNPQGAAPMLDPRSKVVISDCTLFDVENPDHYPPDLETLVRGVKVVSRTTPQMAGGRQATDNQLLETKTKVYLRRIPDDPITGKPDWNFHSCYDQPDSPSWGGENIFDVSSKAEGTALNGEKYSDW
jgi:general secretion pathway protein G